MPLMLDARFEDDTLFMVFEEDFRFEKPAPGDVKLAMPLPTNYNDDSDAGSVAEEVAEPLPTRASFTESLRFVET